MKYGVSLVLATAALCVTVAASAQERRFQLGLRTGYALPMGKIWGAGSVAGESTASASMSDEFSGQVPIWIDVGYRVTPNLMLGLYFQYGFVFVKDQKGTSDSGCPSGSDCSAHNLRYGIQAHYYFMPGETVNPWLGFGIGRESLGLSEKRNGAESSGTLSGWEYAILQAGLDFAVTSGFDLGPFVNFSMGQYSSMGSEVQGVSVDVEVPEKAMHEWLTFGVKGTLTL